jgi:hypothetical protein
MATIIHIICHKIEATAKKLPWFQQLLFIFIKDLDLMSIWWYSIFGEIWVSFNFTPFFTQFDNINGRRDLPLANREFGLNK